MSGLVERLEAAEVGSRALDLDIAQALSMKLWGRRHPHNNSHQWMTEIDGKSVPVPRYTTSLDAALALAERAHPKARRVAVWRDPFMPEGRWDASVDRNSGRSPVPALALCIAILRALKLNETRHAE